MLTDTDMNISWSITESEINGFVVTVVLNDGSINGSGIVFNSSVSHTVFTNLTPGVYTITVFAYKDLLSVERKINMTLNISSSLATSSETSITN